VPCGTPAAVDIDAAAPRLKPDCQSGITSEIEFQRNQLVNSLP
jgi:hypothetical protein